MAQVTRIHLAKALAITTAIAEDIGESRCVHS